MTVTKSIYEKVLKRKELYTLLTKVDDEQIDNVIKLLSAAKKQRVPEQLKLDF